MSIQKIPVEEIQPSPFNTRGEILDEDLGSLVQSIRETGLVEPVKVRTVLDGAYELVSGERRLRAMRILGFENASCIVREMSDAEVLLEQWAENEERKDLSDYAKAEKLKQIMEANKISQTELGKKLGKSPTWITNHLHLLKLKQFFSAEILNQLTAYQGNAILSAPDEDIPVVCAEVERHYEEEKTLPSAADIADFIKGIHQTGSKLIQQDEEAPEHEHVYDAGSTRCRICGRELTAPESVASGIGPICAQASPSSPETMEDEFNVIAGRLGIVNAPEEPRYEPSEEEVFAFLNRFKYQKDVDGILLDNMIELFDLSASQALDWLEKWRDARRKSPKLTPEEKIFLEEYERTHPREDDPIKKLVKYYPPELMDTVFTRLKSDNFETVLKYCRRYVEELHIRASDELRRTILEAIRW
jgi:ParB/RepB/Spo0J family partition protein